MKITCPVCKKPITLKDDPNAVTECLAYGSNYAGMIVPVHKSDGVVCPESNKKLQ